MLLDLSEVKDWLFRFKYTQPIQNPDSPELPPRTPTLSESIAMVQQAYGVKPTGELDSKTMKLMTIPRCGNPDTMPLREHLGGPSSTLYKWNLPQNRTLLYYLERESLQGLDLPYPEVQAIIRDAYNAWEATSNIKYLQIDNPNDCDITMGCGSGRQDGFDGPSNILAWAELPGNMTNNRLRLKFDADEPWYGSTRQRGIALLNTACHEIGHLNGLTHSRVVGSLMAPTYSESVPYPVANDDIQRMVWRYEALVIVVPPPVIPPIVPPPTSAIIEAMRIKYVGVEGWQEYKAQKV
jgi:matrixin